ncbi:pantoate--beta-alanine ligase [bacterium]|nr:pantoate--beta-alanine ligase [bacterium]
MIIVDTVAALRAALDARGKGLVGFVPTMGFLHEGHRSLMNEARRACEVVVVSIFVNPKQFGPQEDLSRYPRDLARDRALCEAAGVDVLFVPSVSEMYPPGFSTEVAVSSALTDKLCGAFRPGHFTGVTTVVARLLNLVRPDRAYFGQKDFQQWRVLSQMVRDLAIPTEIVRCPIVREEDGLALSSRNTYLSAEDRAAALRLSRALGLLLREASEGPLPEALAAARAYLEAEPRLTVQYLEAVDVDALAPAAVAGPGTVALVAAQVGTTRLIDNAILDPHGPDAALVALAPKETR